MTTNRVVLLVALTCDLSLAKSTTACVCCVFLNSELSFARLMLVGMKMWALFAHVMNNLYRKRCYTFVCSLQ